jgi:hypothetical protein
MNKVCENVNEFFQEKGSAQGDSCNAKIEAKTIEKFHSTYP